MSKEYPECSGNPASCPENEGHGCCKPNPGSHEPSVGVDAEGFLFAVIEQAYGGN